MELQREAEERVGFINRFAHGIERAREDSAIQAARDALPSDMPTYEGEPV